MAIFGDFQDHALTDLLKVIGSRSGALFLHSAYHRRTIELSVQQGHIEAVYLDGFPVASDPQRHDIFHTLVVQREGTFEFKEHPQPQPRSPITTLNASLQAVAATALVPEEQLPHAETVYVLHNVQAAVPSSLADSWNELRPLLADGGSARQLAARTPHDEQHLRWLFYQFRASDLIASKRTAAPPDAAPAPASPSPAPQLIHRLLGALRRFRGASGT